jgi:hypothetical protein
MKFRFLSSSLTQKFSTTLVLVTLFALASTSAVATPINLVKNGDFEQTVGFGEIGLYSTVANWTSTGFNFIFAPGMADTTGAPGAYGQLQLWGANNGGANALATSSNGGNFIANDGAFGAYGVPEIKQTITGLTVGATYEVSFEWAAAQQFGFDGPTTEWWRVNLGSNWLTTQATGIYSNAVHSSSDWMHETMRFTAANTSEVLSFLAVGTPEGKPPFSLLDGVSMREVPEPSSWLMLFTGLGLIGVLARRRRKGDIA